MDRVRSWFGQGQAYEALDDDPDNPTSREERLRTSGKVAKFEYSIFLLLGCAMLWGWNMFMACATYFQRRFVDNDFLLNNFQSLILAFATLTNVVSAWYLSKKQSGANYPTRILLSLILNIILSTILALSTIWFKMGPEGYVVIVLGCVFLSSWSTGLSQNGVFAFVNTFGGSYMQAVMTGQGIAGVLPAIAQIFSVLLVPPESDDLTASPKSAFIYFMTATVVSLVTLILFLVLLSRHHISPTNPNPPGNSTDHSAVPLDGSSPTTPSPSPRKSVPLWTLLMKLKYLSFSIWFCFFVTMAFPIFTQAIVSVRPLTPSTSRLFTPDVFIPFGFLIWNFGDLSGRIICGFDMFKVTNPRVLAFCALSRVGFIPLYFLCNFKGAGAVVNSDIFYWVVGFTFGMTNGWVGSNVMMAAPELVEEDEREASGGFMGLCLVAGLATGSLASFLLG